MGYPALKNVGPKLFSNDLRPLELLMLSSSRVSVNLSTPPFSTEIPEEQISSVFSKAEKSCHSGMIVAGIHWGNRFQCWIPDNTIRE
jgi:hypothetical protein